MQDSTSGMQFASYLLAVCEGAVLSLVSCAGVRRWAPRLGAVVAPRDDRWHVVARPMFGGLGAEVLRRQWIDEVVVSTVAVDETREAQVREIGARVGVPVRRLYLEIR